MNRIERIKAAQIAAAEENGEDNPYLKPTGKVAGLSNKPLNALQQVKQNQIDEAEKTGESLYQPETAPEKPAHTDIKDLKHYQTALDLDITKVASQKDMVDKLRVKQAVLPTYLAFVDDYVKSGVNYSNNVAVQVMIWLLDILEIEHGLDLALHLVKQNQLMPARFDRDMKTFLCDFFYDWGNEMLKNEQGVSPYLDTLIIVAEQDQWQVHPLCMSKLYSMLAKHKERTEDYQQALDLCEKAEAINPEKAGVKGLKERLQKQLTE